MRREEVRTVRPPVWTIFELGWLRRREIREPVGGIRTHQDPQRDEPDFVRGCARAVFRHEGGVCQSEPAQAQHLERNVCSDAQRELDGRVAFGALCRAPLRQIAAAWILTTVSVSMVSSSSC